jgi:hypothetical protein
MSSFYYDPHQYQQLKKCSELKDFLYRKEVYVEFLSYFLNNDLPEYYEDKHNAIHFPFENKKETTGSKRDNTLPKVYTYRLESYFL